MACLGMFSTNLIICSIDRFPSVWKIVTADNLAIPPERIEKMSNCSKWEFATDKLKHMNIADLLKQNGWSMSSKKIDNNELFFSQKGRWSRIGVYIVHVSILLIFAGAVIGHFFGFKGSVMIPEMSSTQKVFAYKNAGSLELGFEVRCNSFTIEFYDNGMPKEYKSSLTVLENGKEMLTKEIEVNSPLTYKGITFYQSSYQGYQDFLLNITESNSGEFKQFISLFKNK